MKFLHTSDWHLGRTLYNRKRYEEFTDFLNWLSDKIEEEYIDVLLISGDIFDTSTPSNRAQELYYRFLNRVSNSCCQHIVIIAGNHDSPTFLNAPRELLKALNVYVVGNITSDPKDEVFLLKDEKNEPQAIVCAVPYLRDRDIRMVEAGETLEDKNRKLIDGIKNHYTEVCQIAEEKQLELSQKHKIPIIAMGHLFAAGGKTTDGDGVRELYVGSLAHVEKDMFSPSIDYLALGHLHVPQKVSDNIRYSGSPLPMGFGEAKQQKKILLYEYNETDDQSQIKNIPVPCFQPLVKIVGTLTEIEKELEQLKKEKSQAWIEVEYTGTEIIQNLRTKLDEHTADSALEILRVKNKNVIDRVIRKTHVEETLDDIDEYDVFKRCLDAHDIPSEERDPLLLCYKEIVHSLHVADRNAE